jgi:hypothetical protein
MSAVVLLAAAGCAEEDPLVLLAESRAATEVQLKTWMERSLPGVAAEEVGVDREDSAEDSGVGEGLLPERAGFLTLLVVDRGAPLELPCLTIDVVYETGEGEAAREIDRRVEVLDISRLKETGGLDLVLEVPLPETPVSAIGVDLHRVAEAELMSLCEAQAIRPVDG